MEISIRSYADSDFDAVSSIWLRSWQSTGVPAPVTLNELRERWPQELAKGWVIHVATAGPEIVGFLALREDKLEQLFVAPGAQGKGVGKHLLDFAKAARPNGFHLTTALESAAGRFYEREGLTRGETTAHARFGHPIVRYDWRP